MEKIEDFNSGIKKKHAFAEQRTFYKQMLKVHFKLMISLFLPGYIFLNVTA
jgi:hypothetical protein